MGQCCGNSRKSGLPSNDTAAGMKRVGTRWDKNSEKNLVDSRHVAFFLAKLMGFKSFSWSCWVIAVWDCVGGLLG